MSSHYTRASSMRIDNLQEIYSHYYLHDWSSRLAFVLDSVTHGKNNCFG